MENVTLYNGPNFTGDSFTLPHSWFGTFSPSKTVVSLKVPSGYIVTLFTRTPDDVFINGTYTSYSTNVTDTSCSGGTSITFAVVQSSTIQNNGAQSVLAEQPVSFYDKPFMNGSVVATMKTGTYDWPSVPFPSSFFTGSNVVKITDVFGKEFMFYSNVYFYRAYSMDIKKVTVVPLPLNFHITTDTAVDGSSSTSVTNTRVNDKNDNGIIITYVEDLLSPVYRYIDRMNPLNWSHLLLVIIIGVAVLSPFTVLSKRKSS